VEPSVAVPQSAPIDRRAARVVEVERAADSLRQVVDIPADSPWFDGHFPGDPVLAGAVQIRWALAAAAELIGAPVEPTEFQQLKFKNVIRPGDRVTLDVARVGGGVTFRYSSARGEHSSARIMLAATT
jgi:3-hydroxymyristoyl/3-hydroxydecanoyl-(acyl carrier protein) dehydratase